MQILDLAPNTPEWLEARLDCFCASEAPAMMGKSKFMSRNQLLALKKGWQSNPVDSFKQQLFDKGHEHEDTARSIAEMYLVCDLPPVVGSATVAGMTLLASFDGLDPGVLCWEHKSWNQVLSENVRNGVLEALYYWQLEHQMLVAGVDKTAFAVSNGTSEQYISMWYYSVPERRKQLVKGWAQFAKDLDEYEIEARQEVIVAKEAEALPALSYHVENGVVIHSLNEYLPAIKDRAAAETSRILETEQDFADKDKFNKATKIARSKLKEAVESVQGEFISFSNFALIAAEIDVILQKMQSAGEKQVTKDKAAKKQSIIDKSRGLMNDHIHLFRPKVEPMNILILLRADHSSVINWPNWVFALKNKRTIESWQNAADEELARVKIEIDAVMARVLPNLEYLREHAEEYKFLFADAQQLVNQEAEPFQAIVKSRIADHKQVEADKAEALRLIQVEIDGLVNSWIDAVEAAMNADNLEKVELLITSVEASRYSFNPEMCGDRYSAVMASHKDAMSTLTALKIGLEEAAAEKQQEDQAVMDLANAEMGDERPTEDLLDRHNMPEVSDYDAGIAPTPETNAPAKDPLGFPAGPEEDEPRFQGSDSDEFVTLNVDDEMPIEDSLSIDLGNFIKKWDLCEEAVDDLHQIMANYHIPL